MRKQLRKIGVLDMETDPFDEETEQEVRPFLAILECEDLPPIIIWDEDYKRLVLKLVEEIEKLPDRYIIYAHNGGRFDYLHMLHELRGRIAFKGRGIMSASIGQHELRDSYHILPEALRTLNRKTDINYDWFKPANRNSYRDQIISYCLDDCRDLLEVVRHFVEEFGTPITIGQASMAELKKFHTFECLSANTDAFMRQWFQGGRVECRARGLINGPYQVVDVNSMYPKCMADYPHPVSANFSVHNTIRANTTFITLSCTNRGAFGCRLDNGAFSFHREHGIFKTTIWEYEVAKKHGLISNERIIQTIEFEKTSDFGDFVRPIYDSRQRFKDMADKAEAAGDMMNARRYRQMVTFKKFLLNNAYGKFAQNPRRYKEYWITDPNELPDGENWGLVDGLTTPVPEIENADYWIWSRHPSRLRFNNVAAAASITGAARSILLDALCTSHQPLYCDTDSLICTRLAEHIEIDRLKLGAWDCEAKLDQFIGAGKKLYAFHRTDKEPPKDYVIKAKGMNGVTWQDMLDISSGKRLIKKMHAPTLSRDGSQVYISRLLRATGVDLPIAA
jgi:DNA polymerase elongation subunit (family B)